MKRPKIKGAARIALLYAVAGSVWILLSDRLIAGLVSNPERLTWLQTYKGWGFVLITAVLLFVERRWSEAALRTSRARFSSVVQAVPSVILWLSPNGEILEFNQEAERIYGRRREEVLGQNYFDLFLTEDIREIVKENQQRVVAGRQIRGFENPVKAANGEERILTWNAAPLLDDRGQPMGTIAVGHDITERKRAKQALEESEARYKELFDNINSGVAVYEARDNGQNFIFKDFNKSAEKIDAIKKEAVIGRSVVELFPGIKEIGLFDVFQRVWETGQPERHPITFYRDERAAGWRENYVYKLPSGEVVAVYDDISQRKQAERQLRYQADLLQNVSDAVIATNMNFTILSWNKAAEKIYGWTAAEAMGQDIRHLLLTLYPDDNRQEVLAQLRQEGFWQGEIIQTGKDGTPINIFASASLLKDRTGNPTGFVAVNRDITERKQAEEALRESERILNATGKLGKIGGWEHDLVTGKAVWTEALYDIIEIPYDREPPGVDEHLSYYSPRDRKVLMQAYNRAVKNGVPFDLELQAYTATKKPIWCRAQGEPVYENGKCVAIRGIFQDITERKQVEESLQRYTKQLEALHQIALKLAAKLDLDTLLSSIVSQAMQLVRSSGGGFFLYRPERDVLEWSVAIGSNHPPQGTVLHRGEGLSGRVWETGQPLIVDDYQQWEGHAAIYADYSWQSVVGVPVRQGEEFLGVLVVLDDKPGAFSSNDAELLNLLAPQAAIAIYNARLFEAEQRARQVAETLREATTALASTLQLQQVLDNILTYLERVVSYDSSTVMLIEGEHLRTVAGRGYPDSVEVTGHLFPLKDAYASRSGQLDQPVYLNDVQDEPQFILYQPGPDYIRGWLCVPLIVRGQPMGYLTLDSRQVGAYGEKEVELAQVFANQAAIAIHNARLFESERQQRLNAETLRQVTTTLASKTETEAVLDEILNQVKRIVPYQTANIALLKDDALRTVRWQGYDRFGSEQFMSELEQPLANYPMDVELVQTGQPVLIQDTHQEPSWVILDETDWIRAFLAVPIRLGERVLAELRLDSPTPGEFSLEDAERLRPLADAAAIALENARLLEAERAAQEQLRNLAEYLQTAREEERTQIAREVHDEFGQALTALKMDVAWLTKRLPPQETKLIEKTESMSTLVDGTMQMVRRIATELRPGMLDDLGLLATMEWQAQEFTERTGIVCELKLTEQDLGLERDLATALFRIFQEILTNIMRHASATRVEVNLESSPDELRLIIRDNGQGITPRQIDNLDSLGLLGMRERARAWDGSVTFQGKRGQGTTVTIRIPQPAVKEAQDD